MFGRVMATRARCPRLRGLEWALLVLLLVGVEMARAGERAVPSESWLFQARRPLIVSHRGSRLLNPENTLLAFHSALHLGADVLEMDVRLTADNQLVVFHDDHVNRTTDGHGLVRENTLEQILALDAGYRYTPDEGKSFPYRGQADDGEEPIRVPTFDQFLREFPTSWINVEIKDHEFLAAELTWEHLRKQENFSSRFVVVSRFCDVIDHFRNITRGTVATAACESEATNQRIKMLFGSGASTLDYYLNLPVPPVGVYQLPTIVGDFVMDGDDMIAYLHSLGAKVQYWVVNDARYMRKLFSKGVDGIITDRPDLARQVLSDMGHDATPLVHQNEDEDSTNRKTWRHYIPPDQVEELHECVTLVCLFFAYGIGAIIGLFLLIASFITVVVLLAKRLCKAPSRRATVSRSTRHQGKMKLS